MYQSRDKVNRTTVAITLLDGTMLTASLRLPLSNKLGDALNNGDVFLDVVTPAGEQHYISKPSIRSVRPMEMPRAEQLDLDGRVAGLATADPHAILKVGLSASADEIKHAYHRMARLYHPDRIASYELPEEIKDYMRAMLVQINLAFEQLRR